MAAVTGVSPNAASVRSTYDALALQLPATADLRTFASAQQVALTKLSLEYCDALVETPTLRTAFFGSSVDFAAPATSAFSSQTAATTRAPPPCSCWCTTRLVARSSRARRANSSATTG